MPAAGSILTESTKTGTRLRINFLCSSTQANMAKFFIHSESILPKQLKWDQTLRAFREMELPGSVLFLGYFQSFLNLVYIESGDMIKKNANQGSLFDLIPETSQIKNIHR